MGYLKIQNLYKDQRILLFKEVYCLEKVHGSSAHVSWRDNKLKFFSGENYPLFVNIFDQEKLRAGFEALGLDDVIVYGEAYGGRCQGMKKTYGDKFSFIAFDVAVGRSWLDVPDMARIAESLGFEVVPWEKTTTDTAVLDAIRDRPSEIAIRRGYGPDRPREGVVLRPLIELNARYGERIICKHKSDAFRERATSQKIKDPGQLVVLADAAEVAEEWVVEHRLSHVLDHLAAAGVAMEMESMGKVIEAMVEDVYREAKGEIVESEAVRRAIGRRTSRLFKYRIEKIIHNNGIVFGDKLIPNQET